MNARQFYHMLETYTKDLFIYLWHILEEGTIEAHSNNYSLCRWSGGVAPFFFFVNPVLLITSILFKILLILKSIDIIILFINFILN